LPCTISTLRSPSFCAWTTKANSILSALLHRLAQQIEARLLAVFAAPQLIQHAALQPFALKLQGVASGTISR
jgi:hypothetical protein